VNLLILVVDDEPDVEALFRQHFGGYLRAGRFNMEFAQSAPTDAWQVQHVTGKYVIADKPLTEDEWIKARGADIYPAACPTASSLI
jgi:hypothetical protein